ncbi:AMP-binding protein [Pseudonocardia spinosispora]|uniref:AMP-binding protein n=1 Tax=Pseudonocardia spinosispora TaxID=103441 RepID=UPI0003FE40D7|nr:AMP-binding protein [Pseudonocardia spinosispora]
MAGPETLLDVLARRAVDDPDAELLRFGDDPWLRVGQIDEGARDLAARLAPLIGRGDRVATCLRPGRVSVELIFGLAMLGAVEVPLALDVTESAARAVLNAARVDLVVVGTGALAGNSALAGVLTEVRTVVGVPEPGARTPPDLALLEDLPPGGYTARSPGPGDPLAILSTSGTTGRAKAAVLPHYAAVRHAGRVCATMGYGTEDVLLNVFPWNHINVRHAALLPALLSGARLIARPRFSASRFWDSCRLDGVTAFNFMGAMLAILDRRPPDLGDSTHPVRLAYGAPAPIELARRFHERFGVRALEAYACTELGDVAANTVDTWRPGSAGRVVPEYEVAILGEDGNPLPVGEIGQIAARPRRNDMIFVGYAGDTDATTAALRDGWFRTGDRGRLDADGYLYFAGRHADVVRRRGENIASWDVEQVIAAMPGVVDVAAVAVPSELTEDEVLVALSIVAGAGVDGSSVREWCRTRLPRHALPRFVRIVPDLPRNPNGKVLKHVLADHGPDEQTWDAERQVTYRR